MPTPPSSFLILPCPVLRGAGDGVLLESTFTGGGALPDGIYPDVAAPVHAEGGIQISQAGSPTARQNLDYRLVASGGIWAGAAWAWKRSTDSTPSDNLSVVWRGANDGRYWWAPHDPFCNDEANPTPTQCIAYSSVNRMELVYRVATSGLIQVAKRTVDDHAYAALQSSAAAWSIDDCSRDGLDLEIPSNLSALVEPLQVVELDDGTMMMCTITHSSGGYDLVILHSANGVTWTTVCDNVLSRFSIWGALQYGSYGLQMQKSGNYVRICFVWYFAGSVDLATDYYLRTIVSGDRGATWTEVSATAAVLDAQFDISAETDDSGPGAYCFTLASLDDQAGSFMLFLRKDGSTSTVRVHSAVGMESWAARSPMEISQGSNGGLQLAATRGPDYLYLFVWYEDTQATPEQKCDLYLIDPRDPFTLSSWKYETDLFKDYGAMRMRLRCISLANVGNNYLAMSASPHDPEDGFIFEETGLVYLRFSGWDSLPMEERDHPRLAYAPPYEIQPGLNRDPEYTIERQLAIVTWDAWMGACTPPSGANVAASSPWTRPDHSATVQDWNTSRTRFTDVTAVSSQLSNQFDVASPTRSWFAATGFSAVGEERGSACLEWIVRVEQGGSITSDAVAIRIKTYDVAGSTTNACDVSIQMNGDTDFIRIYDNVAAADIIAAVSIGGDLSAGYWKFRLGFLNFAWDSGAVKCALWARNEESATANWTLLGRGTVSTAGTHTQQRILYGHLTAVTAVSDGARRISQWRRVALFGPHDGGATRCIADGWGDPGGGASNDDTMLDNLRGRPATHDPVLVEKGITAQLQGGAGLEGDNWAGAINFAFHPRNVTMIGSPRIGFRSAIPTAGTTAVNLDYDAGWDDSGRSFQHSAIAFFGYAAPLVSILYADNSSFSGATTFAVDMTLYGPAKVDSAAKNVVQILSADPECPPLGEVSSEPNGGVTYYMRITAASCSTAVGKVFVVENDHNWSSTVRAFTLDVGDDGLTGYSLAGASVTFYADRRVVLFSPQNFRYMRISMPSTTTAYANQHRLGSFIAGTTLQLIGLDWSHTDSEHSNLTQHTTKGGMRWGYPEGPPARSVQGLIVGDVDSVRRRMRSYLRALSGYDQHPVVLVQDDADLGHPAKMMLGTVVSGSEFQQDAWKWDDAQQRWLAVGNMKLTLNEEV